MYAETPCEANEAAEKAFERINAVERVISDWLVGSEVTRLKVLPKGQAVQISDELNAILELSFQISHQTDGIFDVTCGALTTTWREARQSSHGLELSELSALASSAGWRRLNRFKIDHVWMISMDHEGIWLDFGGIGKGYAADAALETLRQNGIQSALVEMGGDMAIGDPPPGQHGWSVASDSQSEPLVLSNCGVATSGSETQFIEHDGQRWSHLLNPTSGMPITHEGTCTVVAENASVADGWASVAAIVGIADAKSMADPNSRIKFLAPASP